MDKKKIPQDIVGDIAILKFKRDIPLKIRKAKAKEFLDNHKNIVTVLEKKGKFKGSLRKQSTTHLAGLKTKRATYKENNCVFKFDVDETYFSPRLSHERKITSLEIAKKTKKKTSKILVMFAGVAPFPIVLAKILKEQKKQAAIYSNEMNKKANEYAKENIRLNKLQQTIELLSGNAKNLPKKTKEKFDIILMTRPNTSQTFLRTALELSKKGTTIFYHGFGTKKGVEEEIKKDVGDKIGRISIRKAGDIGPHAFRWLAKFSVK